MKENLERAVIRLKNGDESAFNEIYDEVYRLVFYIANQELRRREDAEDITSDVMFTIYQKINTLQDTSKFKSWVCIITKNKVKDRIKHNISVEKLTDIPMDEETLFDPDTGEAISDPKTGDPLTVPKISTGDSIRKKQETEKLNSLEYRQWFDDIRNYELQEQIEEVFGMLPEVDRDILLYHYEEGMTNKEIGQVLGMKPTTVRSRVQIATKKVRAEFEERKKKGMFAYSLAPFFLFKLFREQNSALLISNEAKAASVEAIKSGIQASGGYGSWASSIPKVKAVRKIATMSAMKKGVAAVVAASIVAGGTIGVANIYADDKKNVDSNRDVRAIAAEEPSINSEDDITQETNDFEYMIINDDAGNVIGINLSGCNIKGDIQIPTEYQGYKVLAVNTYCFDRREGIKKITVPSGVKIESNAFYLCDVQEIIVPDDLTELPDNAFSYCPNLKSMKLPSKLKKMGRNIFQDCFSLESVDFYNEGGIKKLGEQTFDGCENLKEVILPDTIEEIGLGAFHNCKALTNVHLPKGLKKIGVSVFYHCTSLSHIEIPDTVEEIGHSNFNNCPITTLKLPKNLISFSDSDQEFPEEATFIGSKIETIIFEDNCKTEYFSFEYEIPTLKRIHIGNNFELFKRNLGYKPDDPVVINNKEYFHAVWSLFDENVQICTNDPNTYNQIQEYLNNDFENDLSVPLLCNVVLCNDTH